MAGTAVLNMRIWMLLITIVRLGNSQFPFPMYPPMQPMPVPIPMPLPFAIRLDQTSSTSSTTTEQSVAVAVPIALPMPMHIAVPALPPPVYCQRRPRPYNCPPCPPCSCAPSCTPAFFAYCSPCHQKCKCHRLAPPTYKQMYHRTSSCSADSSSSSSSSSEWEAARRRITRRNRRRSLRSMRKNLQISEMESSGSELVEPVLTYLSRNGEIKFKKRISTDEAAQLLGNSRRSEVHQNVKVLGGEDNKGRPQVLVVSSDAESSYNGNKRKQVVLGQGTGQHVLGEGRKELIFRPPGDKRITNLTVSFQVV